MFDERLYKYSTFQNSQLSVRLISCYLVLVLYVAQFVFGFSMLTSLFVVGGWGEGGGGCALTLIKGDSGSRGVVVDNPVVVIPVDVLGRLQGLAQHKK